jgi:PAS domain S-box-containing protein
MSIGYNSAHRAFEGRRRRMTYSKRLFILFATAIVVLLGSLLAMFWIGILTFNELKDVGQRQDTINSLRSAQALLTDVETSQRGYLITGNAEYLKPYNTALWQLITQQDDLDDRAAKHQLDPADVVNLDKLIRQRLAELKQSIDLRKQNGLDAALPAFQSNAEKQTTDSVRKLFGQMVSHESAQRRIALTAAGRSISARVRIFFVVLVLNPIVLVYAYWRIRKESRGRYLAALDVQRQKDLLAVTLASIGDAVMVTDPQTLVTYMNSVAEMLTGWTLAEAQGQPCAAVFNVINEETRQPVENPVERVLANGVVVGLANHTLLIRKDGSEVPIDDSGAPIRDADGVVRGVVLIFRDFSERKEAERKLLAAKLEVEAASKAKDQFLASLSHELRTPLTPVLATLTSWESGSDMPARLRSDVEMLRRNIDLEARLIDDLLDLTRIAKGKMSLNRELADVHALVQAALRVCEADIAQKQIRVSMSLDAASHHAQVDPARLQQVFWNVLKNATKFTPTNGTIQIKSGNTDGHVQVAIADNGIGMPKETVERLFLPFEQGTGDITRRFGGLGLGMTISKAIIDELDGTIAAHSDGAGQGSTFTITLPAVAAPKASTPVPSDTRLVSRADRRQLKILLVEDHRDTADVIERLLRGLGHQVEVSESVAAANTMAQSQAFDLLLSDIGLPDGTGIDVIRQVRQSSQTPAIAMTGYGMEDDIAKCRAAGFNAHLTKPVSFEKLRSLISEIT